MPSLAEVNYLPDIPESVSTDIAAKLMGYGLTKVKSMIYEGTLPARGIPCNRGRGGITYSIPVSALPESAQEKWRLMQSRQATVADISSYTQAKAEKAVARAGLERKARAEAKRIADEAARAELKRVQARIEAMQELDHLKAGPRGRLTMARKIIADKLGICLRRLYELEDAWETEGANGLMDKTARSDKGLPRTMCLTAQEYIAAEYCTTDKVRQNVIYDNLKKQAAGLGPDFCAHCPHNPNSLAHAELKAKGQADDWETCEQAGNGILVPESRYAVNRFVRLGIPEQLKMVGRKGWKYWDDKLMPKAKREKPELINEVWFADHHVFDCDVNYKGKAMRPWLTALTDARSNAMVGWAISFNPNTDTIIESLITAIARTHGSPFSGAPMILYMDNGKDYASYRLNGHGRPLTQEEIGLIHYTFEDDNALLRMLGIGVQHATPYYAWVKPIERVFGTIESRWIRGLPGYCGNSIVDKPEKLAADLKAGRLMDWTDFVELWANKIWPEYNNFRAEGAEASPMEIYMNGRKARTEEIPWSSMSLAKLLSDRRLVKNVGLNIVNRTYMHPALAPYIGSYVNVRYTKQYIGSVSVYTEDGRYICEAEDTAIRPYKMVGEDPERIAELQKFQRGSKKSLREQLALQRERVRYIGEMACEIPDIATNGNINSLVHEQAYRAREDTMKRAEARQDAIGKAERVSRGRIHAQSVAAGERILRIGANTGDNGDAGNWGDGDD